MKKFLFLFLFQSIFIWAQTPPPPREQRYAPASAGYVVVGSFSNLLYNERLLTCGAGLTCDDDGPGAHFTISVTGLPGGAGAASNDEPFITLSNTGGLSAERRLAAGIGIALTDHGANSYLEIKADVSYCPDTGTNHLNFDGSGFICGTSGGGSAHLIQDEGVDLAAESRLNFIGGSVNCTDNPGVSTVCTFSGSPTIDATSILGGSPGNIFYHKSGDVFGELSSLSSFETDLESFLNLQNLQGPINGTKIRFGSDAQGDVAFFNGTDWARLGAGTSGYFLKTNGAGANPQWADPGSSVSMPQAVLARKWFIVQPSNTTGTTMTNANGGFVGVNSTSATFSGTASVVLDTRVWIRYTTSTSPAQVAGIITSSSTFSDARPRAYIRFRTKSSLPSTWSYHAGISSGSQHNPVVGTPACASRGVFITASDSVNASKWMCCACDSSNESCTSMAGTAVAAGTEYVATVDYSVGGTLSCTMTGNSETISITHTTNLPTGTNGIGISVSAGVNPSGTAGVLDYGMGMVDTN